LSGFSVTKYTKDKMAKKVVYMVNQYAPIKRPLLFISVVMCTTLRETLTQAAAHAYDLSSIAFPVHDFWET
jgi:hypothetical protein